MLTVSGRWHWSMLMPCTEEPSNFLCHTSLPPTTPPIVLGRHGTSTDLSLHLVNHKIFLTNYESFQANHIFTKRPMIKVEHITEETCSLRIKTRATNPVLLP